MKYISIITCLVFFVVLAGCKDEKCGGNNRNYQYLLEVNVDLSPAKEEYTIGDTVSLTVIVPRRILDRNHDVVETIAEQSLQHLSFVNRVDTVEENSLTNLFFEMIGPSIGNPRFENVGRSVYITGEYVDNSSGDWELSYRVVLKRTGVYFFSFGYFVEGHRRAGGFSLMNECGNGTIQLFHVLNNGANNNWQLLCESNDIYCIPAWDEAVRDRTFDQHAGYVFKVTE